MKTSGNFRERADREAYDHGYTIGRLQAAITALKQIRDDTEKAGWKSQRIRIHSKAKLTLEMIGETLPPVLGGAR